MPVKIVKRRGKYRLVDASTGRIDMTDKGNPRDGGGHKDKAKAERQAGYINEALAKKAAKQRTGA